MNLFFILKITGTQVREPIIFILSYDRVRERDPLRRVFLETRDLILSVPCFRFSVLKSNIKFQISLVRIYRRIIFYSLLLQLI